MQSDEVTRWCVVEVHNFGGFFGGDTVTLTARRWGDETEETITIDEQALANLGDRHLIAPSMVFDLIKSGERVDRAELVGAIDWPALDSALGSGPPAGPLVKPRIRAYRCGACNLWLIGEPLGNGVEVRCKLCGHEL